MNLSAQSTDAGWGATWLTLFGMMIANHQYDCLWMSLSRLYLMFSGFIHPGLQYIYI